jgi:radical SAM/Cys-rich protein
MHETLVHLRRGDFPALRRRSISTLQVNLGYRCNQSCQHCHVAAGPHRTEMMDRETAAEVLRLIVATRASTLDLTGGAPELNPHFRWLVEEAVALGCRVIDRCNLTVLEEQGQQDLAEFLAHHRVEIVASLPCYLEDNVDRQRGQGVFEASLRGLRRLNELGYGDTLSLSLVFNPQGPSLPPPQESLEADYRRVLGERYGIRFTRLLTLANMPIQRFGSMLISQGRFDDYMALLRSAHRDDNLASVMCRDLVSIDWRGEVYDCDFNQMLGLKMRAPGRPRLNVRDLIGLEVEGLPIVVADHCFGCTAGQGSSCGGALATSVNAATAQPVAA